jgi:serine/threonine protein kinase
MESQLLAAGGFGCVFRPRIACDGTPTTDHDTVTKVQAADSAAANEMTIGSIIKGVRGYRRFFGVALSSCRIRARSLTSGILDQCDVIRSAQDLVLMSFDYIPNVSMHEVAKAALHRKEDVYVLLHSYTLLLRSLVRLADVDVVHLDLKPENVLYDAVYHIPVIIDFGIAVDMKTLSPSRWEKVFYTYSPEYYLWPPEVHAIAYLLHVNPQPTARELTLLAENITAESKALAGFSVEFRARWSAQLAHTLRAYVGMPRHEAITQLITTWKTWDNYAISMMYLRFLHQWSQTAHASNSLYARLLETFLWGVHADPVQRYTPQESLGSYNRIFQFGSNVACLIGDLERFVAER